MQAEEAMIEPDVELPSFGFSTWPYAAPNKGEESVAARSFYNAWINFATQKDFQWMDQWNLAEAPDRRVRRYVHTSLLPL